MTYWNRFGPSTVLQLSTVPYSRSTQKLKNKVGAVCLIASKHARHEKNHRLLKSAFREKGTCASREQARARGPA